MAKRVQDFRKIWVSFVKVAEAAKRNRAIVCIEWPKGCDYWKRNDVRRLMLKFGFVTSDFNGCMFGLTAKSPGKRGKPISKPWRLAATDPHARRLQRRVQLSQQVQKVWRRACAMQRSGDQSYRRVHRRDRAGSSCEL